LPKQKKYLIVIAGPTAVGKTKATVQIAQSFQSEILSADSRQIYKELNIGTAKPTEQELNAVPHHFINHISIHDPFDAGQFENEAISLLDDLFKKHQFVFVTGGTGLYIRALLEGLDQFPLVPDHIRQKWEDSYALKGNGFLQESLKILDPTYFNTVDQSNHRRLLRALMVCDVSGQPFSSFLNQERPKRNFIPICSLLVRDRSVLYERINARVDHMITEGLADEARSLYAYRSEKALQTVGYQELFDHFDGKLSLDEAIEKIKIHSRRYAKRQLTWFRNQGAFEEVEADGIEGLEEVIRGRMGG
jgi:tRNA dimethylallyltransferase